MSKMNDIAEQVGSKRNVNSFVPHLIDLICLSTERGLLSG